MRGGSEDITNKYIETLSREIVSERVIADKADVGLSEAIIDFDQSSTK